ncbi:hypothetical protein GVAV_001973 [Gurleya vavrai]
MLEQAIQMPKKNILSLTNFMKKFGSQLKTLSYACVLPHVKTIYNEAFKNYLKFFLNAFDVDYWKLRSSVMNDSNDLMIYKNLKKIFEYLDKGKVNAACINNDTISFMYDFFMLTKRFDQIDILNIPN